MLPSLLNRRRYPAFEHLLALGLLHAFIDVQFLYVHVHYEGWGKLMHLPLLLRALLILSSLLGIGTIALAFWARSYPLIAVTINTILYGIFAVLFWLMIKRFAIPQPTHSRLPFSPLVMCALVMIGVIIKSMNAAVKQHKETRCLEVRSA